MNASSLSKEAAAIMNKLSSGASTLASFSDDDVEIGTAPKQLVFENGKVQLFCYEPTATAQVTTPLLIVYSQVGRYTMMDLQPDRSLVRNLLDQGVTVYMIDWGNPSMADRWTRFDDYVEDYLASCVDHIVATEHVSQVSMMGVCEGGVFATCYAALHPERVRGLALAVTPIDFHADQETPDRLDHGYLNRWARNLTPTEIERLVDSFGQLPGHLTGLAFQEMTPVKTLTKYNWDLPDAISGSPDQVSNFLRMEKWLSDRPHHPGEAAKQLLIELYHDNQLVKGEFELDGQPVLLENLTMPVLNVFATNDHIVPPPTSRALAKHVGTDDYQELELRAGHIGTFVSRRANQVFSETLGTWLRERQEITAPAEVMA